jgi:hypothetical protein
LKPAPTTGAVARALACPYCGGKPDQFISEVTMKPILTIMYWMTHINIGATLALIGWMLTLQPQDCLTVVPANCAAHIKAGDPR